MSCMTGLCSDSAWQGSLGLDVACTYAHMLMMTYITSTYLCHVMAWACAYMRQHILELQQTNTNNAERRQPAHTECLKWQCIA